MSLGEVQRARKGGEDRLSGLPDCVLIHLMTFMTIKDSVRTCVLSRRWKDLWKSVPSLVTSDVQFQRMTLFRKFVGKVLSLRDSSVPLHSLDFHHHDCDSPEPSQLLQRVVRYAVSHNIECLKLTFTHGSFFLPCHCIFSCQTLTSLDLSAVFSPVWFPESLNLTALTSLRVDHAAFYSDRNNKSEPFSSCVNLKSLVIRNLNLFPQQIFCISNAELVNLTLHPYNYEKGQKIVLSTPNLCSLTYSSVFAVKVELTASNLSCLKEVKINVSDRATWIGLHSAFVLISWFQLCGNVRSLTIGSNTLKVLSLIPDILNTESPCLDNLKSLKVNVDKPSPLSLCEKALAYLIRNSPSAKVTITNC